jgi:hypothetical protein
MLNRATNWQYERFSKESENGIEPQGEADPYSAAAAWQDAPTNVGLATQMPCNLFDSFVAAFLQSTVNCLNSSTRCSQSLPQQPGGLFLQRSLLHRDGLLDGVAPPLKMAALFYTAFARNQNSVSSQLLSVIIEHLGTSSCTVSPSGQETRRGTSCPKERGQDMIRTVKNPLLCFGSRVFILCSHEVARQRKSGTNGSPALSRNAYAPIPILLSMDWPNTVNVKAFMSSRYIICAERRIKQNASPKFLPS